MLVEMAPGRSVQGAGINTLRTVASPLKELAAGFYLAASKFRSKLAAA
jgi:hypothetical protein